MLVDTRFLNQIQSSLSHPDVKDTWFDELYFEEKSPNNNIRNQKDFKQKEYFENNFIGRYLVRSTESFDDQQADKKEITL